MKKKEKKFPKNKESGKKRAQMVVFDFDDTLLPTSSLSNNYTLKDLQEFDQLDIQCETILKKCLEKAPVSIITNSENDWVRVSSLKYLPRTHSVILNNIDVLSARSLYESQYPNRPMLWKFNVFRSVADQFVVSWNDTEEQLEKEKMEELKKQKSLLNNTTQVSDNPAVEKRRKREIEKLDREMDIISFGDSEIERVALLDLQKMWNSKFSRSSMYLRSLKKLGGLVKGRNNMVKMNVKNIKFINNPTTEQIRKQLKTVQESLEFIFNHNGGLDLALQMNPTDPRSRSVTPPPLPSADQNVSPQPSTPSPASSPSSSSSSPSTSSSSPSTSSITSSSSTISSVSSSTSSSSTSVSSTSVKSSSSPSLSPSASLPLSPSLSSSSSLSPGDDINSVSSIPTETSSASSPIVPSSSSTFSSSSSSSSSSFSIFPKNPPPPPRSRKRPFEALMRLPFHQFLPFQNAPRGSLPPLYAPQSLYTPLPPQRTTLGDQRYRQAPRGDQRRPDAQGQGAKRRQTPVRGYQGVSPTMTYSYDS